MGAADDPKDARRISEEAIAAARAGSIDALGEILKRCQPYLLLIANEELNPELQAKFGASDLVQETFVKVHTEFGRFVGSSQQELLAWMRQILRNCMANLRKHYTETEKRQLGREVALAESPLEALRSGLTDPCETPSSQAAANEQWQAIERALAQLPEHYARVIRLRHQESCSFADIGDRMGCSTEAARKLWTRALGQLRAILESPP
jgi:RNA polymerase sigma-70 factor, ECF subfamily